MKIPVVREYGSWAVFIFSCAAGLSAGLMTRPWLTDRDFSAQTLMAILGIALMINAKNPLTAFLRSQDGRRTHLAWLTVFLFTGLALLVPFMIEGVGSFKVFSLLVCTYIVLIFMGQEHHVITELNGFALLTLSAPIVYFSVTGAMTPGLYPAVFIFFAAGVFKVRMKLKKSLFYRLFMVLYVITALPLFHYLLAIPAVVLLPLAENIVSAVTMREEKLRTTGNIELVKGAIFTVLLGYFRGNP